MESVSKTQDPEKINDFSQTLLDLLNSYAEKMPRETRLTMRAAFSIKSGPVSSTTVVELATFGKM